MIRNLGNLVRTRHSYDIASTSKASYAKMASVKFRVINVPRAKVEAPELPDISGDILKSISAKSVGLEDLDPAKINTDTKAMTMNWSVEFLAQYCKAKGLRSYGSKSQLISRIRKFWGIASDKQTYKRRELRYLPSDFYFIAGKDNSNLDRISRECHVKITVDKANNSISLLGDISSVFKAEAMLADVFKNMQADSFKPYDTQLLGSNMSRVTETIKAVSSAFSVMDKDGTMLLASLTKSGLSDARDVYDKIVEAHRQRPIMLQVPSVDIGQTLTFYPVSDISWDTFHRHNNALKIEPIRLKGQQKGDSELQTLTGPPAQNCKAQLVEFLNACSAAGKQTEITVGLGTVVFFDSLVPKSLPFARDDYETRYTITEFSNWFQNVKPLVSFVPGIVKTKVLAKIKPENSVPSVERFFQEVLTEKTTTPDSNTTRVVVRYSSENTSAKTACIYSPAVDTWESRVINLNGGLDYSIKAVGLTTLEHSLVPLDSYQPLSQVERETRTYRLDENVDFRTVSDFQAESEAEFPRRYSEIVFRNVSADNIDALWDKVAEILSKL